MPEAPATLATRPGAIRRADGGLSGLGLLMQLSGSVFLAFGAYLALAPLMAGAGPGSDRLQVFVVGVLCAIRSLSHRAAGMALLYGPPKSHLPSLKRYLALALAQSAAVSLLMMHRGSGPAVAIFAFVVLMTWPVLVLAMLSRPHYQRGAQALPDGDEDKGFASAAVLMTVFGLMGIMLSAFVLLSIFRSAGSVLTQVSGILWTGVAMLLLARSALQLRAGWQGSAGIDSDKASQSATAYCNLAVVSAVVAGAILTLQMILDGPGLGLPFFIAIAMASYLLLIWPTTIRRFFTEREFSQQLGEDKPQGRAPNTGLPALGWLLLACGGITLVYSLGAALLFRADLVNLQGFAGELTPVQGPSPWIHLAVAALQSYAGYQLIQMSEQRRMATSVFAGASIAVIAYFYLPLIFKMDMQSGLGALALASALGPVFFSLPLAMAALLLVHRRTGSKAA